MNKIMLLALPLFGALFAYVSGLTLALGAHPWWAGKVIWIGLGLGLLLSAMLWGLQFSKTVGLISLTLLTFAAFAMAYIGKSRFAASYAEDAVAGQMWFFGWIATCAFALAILATLVWPHRQHH